MGWPVSLLLPPHPCRQQRSPKRALALTRARASPAPTLRQRPEAGVLATRRRMRRQWASRNHIGVSRAEFYLVLLGVALRLHAAPTAN